MDKSGQDIRSSSLLPDQLAVGFSIQLTEQLSLSSTFNHLFWNRIHNDITSQQELSTNTILEINHQTKYAIGFLGIQRDYADILQWETFQQLFLNMGIKRRITNFDINISILDNHLFFDKNHQYSIVRFGSDYHF